MKIFYCEHGRVPLKRELSRYYRPARRVFGTWNKAIEAAGLTPNPLMFAHHHIAKDGHKCDSLIEKILDNWLYKRNIQHEINVQYPWGGLMTADFKIGNFWIELFGLKGQLRRYDRLRKKKLNLIKQYKLNFIGLSTKDVLSVKTLERKLAPVFLRA